MRQITISLSIVALLFSATEPAFAGKDGVPGRRVGGGSRWTQPKQSASTQTRFAAMAFASRNNLPTTLKMKAIYG